MTTTTAPTSVYRIPNYAKVALGANVARRVAREALISAKRGGQPFHLAVRFAGDMLDIEIEALDNA